MRDTLQLFKPTLHRLSIVAALCLAASVSAKDGVTPNEQSPPTQVPSGTPTQIVEMPPRIVSSPPAQCPPLTVLLACGDMTLRATAPSTLDDCLAIAKQQLQEKTVAAAPLIEAVHKAEEALAPVQSALTAAQKEATAFQTNVDALAAEVQQITESRTASDTERGKVATSLAQLHDARPLVNEALRHLTEAVGKAADDAALAEAHRLVTEKLKAMETRAAELQAKNDELSSAVSAADVKLKDAAARLESARKELATVAGGRASQSIGGTGSATCGHTGCRAESGPAGGSRGGTSPA
jgi:uncharacterized phage infection (PIP) family protein YhgE